MAVKLSPAGTRGVEVPKFLQPLMKAGMGVSHLVFRMLGDRMKIQGQQLLMLTTVGAKAGQHRRSIVARFPDHPGAWLVVWFELRGGPSPIVVLQPGQRTPKASITVGGDTLKVHPESLEGSERDEAWKRVVSAAPGFARYETTTDRRIPIIRLTPEQVA